MIDLHNILGNAEPNTKQGISSPKDRAVHKFSLVRAFAHFQPPHMLAKMSAVLSKYACRWAFPCKLWLVLKEEGDTPSS